jgi:hypothetical protein
MNELRERFLETTFEMLAGERMAEFRVVTAWNPDGVAADADSNRKADAGLAAEIDKRRLKRFRVFGGSPDGSHVEPGWGVDCDEATALELGRMFRQFAIFAFHGEDIEFIECRSGERGKLPFRPHRVTCPRDKRMFTLHVGSRAGRFEPADEEWLVRKVSGVFPSFTIHSGTGVFRCQVEEVRLVSVATTDTRRVLHLAEEIRCALGQEGVGVSCGGVYQRVCPWSDRDFMESVFLGSKQAGAAADEAPRRAD